MILVVDDEPQIRKLTKRRLEVAGFEKIETAENGADALAKIPIIRPACVILDINMPVMDGLELLKRLRAEAETKDLPVLVVTARDSRDDRNEILRAGASNQISKPIDGAILVERVSGLIERKLLTDQLSQFHERLSHELSQAAQMQEDLMPAAATIQSFETRYGVRLASHFQPSSELGGDTWALQAINDHQFGIMMVDFSGHGVSAALNTVRLNAMMNRMDVCTGSPARYMQTINAEIADMLPLGQYCTMLYALVDINANTLTYAAAAAPPPMFGQRDGGTVLVGDGSGLPVGIRPNTEYQDLVVDFPEGSFLFLYSDALFETELGDAGPLGIDGVTSMVESHRRVEAEQALGGVILTFNERAPATLPDDLTAVWLSR